MTTTLNITCRTCGTPYAIVVPTDAYEAWQNRTMLIQDAFPDLSPSEREMLITASCGPCFDEIFADFED